MVYSSLNCNSCGKTSSSKLFCSYCGKILKLPTDINYFELFDIAPSFKVDKNFLKKAYFSLQTVFHPDKFMRGSSEEQEIALHNSSIVNNAYKILSNKFLLTKYLISLNLSDSITKAPIDPEFMMLSMSWHERKLSIHTTLDLEKLNYEIMSQEKKLWDELELLVEAKKWIKADSILDKINIIKKVIRS